MLRGEPDPSETRLPLVSGGLDWLTLTSTSRKSKRVMWRYFNEICASELQLGYPIMPGGAHGYYGKRVRHALWGEKDDRAMLQVSSYRAKRAVLLCADGDNATRMDVQATVRFAPGGVGKYLSEQVMRCTGYHEGRGVPRVCKHVVENGEVQTVWIGSRSSDWFVRLYNKFAESGDEQYKDCVRLEVEIKGKASKALWRHMAQEGLGTGYLLQVLLFHLQRCGVDVSVVDISKEPTEVPRKEKTKQEVTDGWWATQVAPSVARAVAEKGWFHAFSILFRGCLTQEDEEGIIHSLQIAWGS